LLGQRYLLSTPAPALTSTKPGKAVKEEIGQLVKKYYL
jgi:hypothetical protein